MSQSNTLKPSQGILALILIVLVGFLAYLVLTTPDQRTFTDRLGDAIHALPRGVDKASEQFEDRTPGQKLGDEIKNEGQKLKDNTGPND